METWPMTSASFFPCICCCLRNTSLGSCRMEQQPRIEMREADNAREMGHLATACGLLELAAFPSSDSSKGHYRCPCNENPDSKQSDTAHGSCGSKRRRNVSPCPSRLTLNAHATPHLGTSNALDAMIKSYLGCAATRTPCHGRSDPPGRRITSTTEEHQPGSLCLSFLLTDLLKNLTFLTFSKDLNSYTLKIHSTQQTVSKARRGKKRVPKAHH